MEMDLQLSLIAIGVACATAVAVYIVSVIGIKEKSFEEAIAEQKKRSDDLLGSHHTKKEKKKLQAKDKSSSKKLKKQQREKGVNNNAAGAAAASSDLSDENAARDGDAQETHEIVVREQKKNHVEIVDEPEIMEDEDDDEVADGENEDDVAGGLAVPRASSRRSSVSNPNARRDSVIKPILLNKDEITHVTREEVEPANHFEQSHPKDDCELKKQSVDDLSTPPSPRIGGKSSGTNTPVDEVVAFDSPVSLKRSNNSSRSKQKKAVEEDVALSGSKIERIVDKSALTSSEIQNLIDVLLNKQHAGDSEWINKTKSDNSVAGLKKQIEVKEKVIQEEQATVQSLQAKFKELRNEFTAEKTRFATARRQLEEQAQQKTIEVRNLHLRLNKVGDVAMSEKQELRKQLHRMETQFKGVQDEYEAIKTDYRNYRDAEQTIRSKADTLERENGALKTQCGYLEKQLNDAFASNVDMTNQLRNLEEHCRALEERKKSDDVMLQHEYRKLQEREGALIGELNAVKGSVAGLETENKQLRNQANVLESSVKGLDEVNKKYEEVRNAEVGLRNVVNELKGEVGRLEDEVKGSDSRVKELERERDELRAAVEEANRGKVNGEVEKQNERIVTELSGKVAEREGQVAALKSEVERLSNEVVERKGKNDELRHKNQKLVESLNVTEASLQTRIETAEKDGANNERSRKLAKGIAAELCGKDVELSSEDWVVGLLTQVRDAVNEAKQQAAAAIPPPVEQHQNGVGSEVELEELREKGKQLEDEVTHYQGMLKQTETLLSTLQASINVEESKWQAQTADKDKEIERLKASSAEVDKLRTQVEEQLTAKSQLESKCTELEAARVASANNLATEVDDLRKSNETLKGELASTVRKVEDLSQQLERAQHQRSADSSPPVNGSASESSSSNNDSVSKSPPVSPTSNATTTVPATPPSPSTVSAHSADASSPATKEKKKKKGSSSSSQSSSKKQQQQ